MLPSCKVEFDELKKEGFNLTIFLSKWTSFLTLFEPIYPNLVRLFYANLITLDHLFCISSRVKGINVEFKK